MSAGDETMDAHVPETEEPSKDPQRLVIALTGTGFYFIFILMSHHIDSSQGYLCTLLSDLFA